MRVTGRIGDDGGMLTELSNQIANLVEASAPSVVQVKGDRDAASGVIHSTGVVVTTIRAIGRENGLSVRKHDGSTASAELGGWDPATGLAILRAPSADGPALAPSGAPVKVGQLAVAIARSWSNAVTASVGNVAVIGGPLRTGRRRTIDQVFRTTASMHEGFSGGAFVDAAGGLIGITTAASIRGLGVVIPASIAWKAAANLLEHGSVKRGYFGVAGQPVSLAPHQRDLSTRERGVLVVAVTPGGPAADAGILVGDIILAVDGSPLDSPEELMDLLMTTGPGHTASTQLLRGAALSELAVTVGERPAR